MPPAGELDALQERLIRQVRRTSLRYGVLAPGDRIIVAVSGGKDSYGLLRILDLLAPRLPFSIELVALHIDEGRPGYDGAPLARWLEDRGGPFELVADDTYSVVQRVVRQGGSQCSACSRLRRGVLYSPARRLGCAKVALGHHRDDAVATLLMNRFSCGRIQSMPARYLTKDGALEVVRPLIEVAERDLRRLAELARFPILPRPACAGREDRARRSVASLLDSLEREHPRLRATMLAALKNVRPTHLLDTALKREPR